MKIFFRILGALMIIAGTGSIFFGVVFWHLEITDVSDTILLWSIPGTFLGVYICYCTRRPPEETEEL